MSTEKESSEQAIISNSEIAKAAVDYSGVCPACNEKTNWHIFYDGAKWMQSRLAGRASRELKLPSEEEKEAGWREWCYMHIRSLHTCQREDFYGGIRFFSNWLRSGMEKALNECDGESGEKGEKKNE